MKKLVFALIVLVFLVVPCLGENSLVVLETNFGDIAIELFDVNAPNTVDNFLWYVNSGFYDGTIFHRVIPEFMIQGGAFEPNGFEREPNDPIDHEAYNGLLNLRGTISMALPPSEPNAGTSGFFINVIHSHWLDYQEGEYHTVFGHVISDMNVVDAISITPTTNTNPDDPVVINTATQVLSYCLEEIDGDLDDDCKVDFNDYAILAVDWLADDIHEEENWGQTLDMQAENDHDISGEIFVWEDRRLGNDGIYMYDLDTDSEYTLIDNTSLPEREPAISGNIVVWRDYRNFFSTGTDIYAADITDMNLPDEFAVSTAANGQMTPAIDGNIIVWDDYRDGKHDIYGYNLSTESEFAVVTTAAAQQEPAVAGDVVVWRDNRNGNLDIYGYDISSDTEFVICEDTADQYVPKISGDMVIWADERNFRVDLYAADISDINDINDFLIAENVINYDISGEIVVWEALDGSESDIYGYDLLKEEEFLVSDANGDQIEPVISDKMVAWRDFRDVNTANDLYWRQLCDVQLAGDLNNDCSVGFDDLKILAGRWLDCNLFPADACW